MYACSNHNKQIIKELLNNNVEVFHKVEKTANTLMIEGWRSFESSRDFIYPGTTGFDHLYNYEK